MVGGGDPFYLKFWVKLTPLERNRLFSVERVRVRVPQIRNSTNVLSALLSNANSWKNSRPTTDFICTDNQLAQSNQFFSQIHPATQTTGAYE